MRFEFATATRILFGPGTIREVAPIAATFGHRALLVTGATVVRAAGLLEMLSSRGVSTATFSVSGEPTLATAAAGVQRAQEDNCDMVIGFGGGSALDTGKAIAALMTNGGEVLNYLEVIGPGQALSQPAAPYIAIPTTAGTGAEVTRNAVLASPEHHVKVSLRSPLMLPRLAVVDPELTYSLPPSVTANTGLDALTQLIEPYVCNASNPLTDALCQDGIRRVARSLRRAYDDGDDIAAREDMSLASLFGGLALANAKLGAVHGLAGPLGGVFPAPHGALCARLLPFVTDANVRALQSRASTSPALQRYTEVAQWLTSRAGAAPVDGVAWIHDLYATLSVPPLRTYGITEQNFPAVVAQSQQASSMKGNPISLTDEELTAILQQAL